MEGTLLAKLKNDHKKDLDALLSSRHVPPMALNPRGYVPPAESRALGSHMISLLGFATLAGISGGKWFMLDYTTVRLPIRSGYSVDVEFEFDRGFTVKRVFSRGGQPRIKGFVQDVTDSDLSDVAFEASLYLLHGFGEQRRVG